MQSQHIGQFVIYAALYVIEIGVCRIYGDIVFDGVDEASFDVGLTGERL